MQILGFLLKLFCDLYFDYIIHVATESSRLMHTQYHVMETELQKWKGRQTLKLNCGFVTMLLNM